MSDTAIGPNELDAIHDRLSDADVIALLERRGRLIKERMALKIINKMERFLDHGVETSSRGEIIRIAASPNEVFRIQQTMANFKPEDFASILRSASVSDQQIGESLQLDNNLSAEALSHLTSDVPE